MLGFLLNSIMGKDEDWTFDLGMTERELDTYMWDRESRWMDEEIGDDEDTLVLLANRLFRPGLSKEEFERHIELVKIAREFEDTRPLCPVLQFPSTEDFVELAREDFVELRAAA